MKLWTSEWTNSVWILKGLRVEEGLSVWVRGEQTSKTHWAVCVCKLGGARMDPSCKIILAHPYTHSQGNSTLLSLIVHKEYMQEKMYICIWSLLLRRPCP